MTALGWVLLAAALAWVLVVAVLWALQRRLVFPGAHRPDRPFDDPAAVAVTWLQRDGLRCRLLAHGPADAPVLALYFPGNGEDLCSAARQAVALAAHGAQVLVLEYPGFGESPGAPSCASLLAAARAAGAEARDRAQAAGQRLVVVGNSLGSFAAVTVAAEQRCERLLLRAAPASMLLAAAHRYWWLPVRWLLRDRFDNLAVAPAVRCPVLMLHGREDAVVPIAHARALAAAFAAPCRLVEVPGVGHNDLPFDPGGAVGAEVGAFLRPAAPWP